MCGRYMFSSPQWVEHGPFGVREWWEWDHQWKGSFNIAPTQRAPVVWTNVDGARTASFFRWGLIPTWAKDIKRPFINARVETAHRKSSFRSAYKKRRCLIPAGGFYEWKKLNGKKQPYLISLAGEEGIAFAGLWEPPGQSAEDAQMPNDGGAYTFTILTTAANDRLAAIHDRMPVILEPEQYDLWLDTDPTSSEDIAAIFAGPSEDRFELTPCDPVKRQKETGSLFGAD